ncbi:MAG: bifunctional isocitrate dehydrogenase kinase/phosphatase [Betaproteobacteria bacterium]|nr:MAG: bifunctional isocitrate dehydrogenase kinase/phosphatase [Betaproteobacteria bacterium]
MFPQQLTDRRAFDIARAMLEGFDKHYRLFRQASAEAKSRFESADWHGQQRAQRERIEFYDKRVDEGAERLQTEFRASELPMEVWHQVKLHYIGMLIEHHQPELAETFFNSVTTKILHRSYFRNDFIFAQPTYRAYYPTRDTLRDTLLRIVTNFQLQRDFEDLGRDVEHVLGAMRKQFGDMRLRTNFQIQVLSSLFFRNKGAYIVGKIINGFNETPFALPILHTPGGWLTIDTALFGEDELLIVFSFARAYFLVEMEIPAAYVHFLRSMMPRKPRSEIYSALGLHKQGKNLFYRDFLFHLRHSSDTFRTAPGIKGMVMLVFDLPSFPYVFKVIRDWFPPQKDTTREQIKGKYLLVKSHDRVGRMADTLEYSNVAFPRSRFDEELIAELNELCPSLIEEDGEAIVIKHLYIERRMIPLNIYLQDATREQMEHAVIEYGNAIKDMVAANIFPGDMLWKNFGVTRHGKVVFYDYDEIEYLSDCNFRHVPQARNEEEELSSEVWYSVGPKDVFPETFGPFLLGNPAIREVFMKHHAELLDPAFWQAHKQRILAGHVHDVFPYDTAKRFKNQRRLAAAQQAAAVAPPSEAAALSLPS